MIMRTCWPKNVSKKMTNLISRKYIQSGCACNKIQWDEAVKQMKTQRLVNTSLANMAKNSVFLVSWKLRHKLLVSSSETNSPKGWKVAVEGCFFNWRRCVPQEKTKASLCTSPENTWLVKEYQSRLSMLKPSIPKNRHFIQNRRSSFLIAKPRGRKSFPSQRFLSTWRRINSFRWVEMPTQGSNSSISDSPKYKYASTANMTKSKQREAFLLSQSRLMKAESKLEVEKKIGKIFDQANTKADGKLSRKEFVTWYMSVFDASNDLPVDKLTTEDTVDPPTEDTVDPPTEDTVDPPTKDQLNAYSLRVVLPFFAFGFLDNSLMIMFGETIDIALSQRFACSMMISAGLGNTISDAIGVLGSDSIDRAAVRIDDALGTTLKTPLMTQKQLLLPVVRRRKTVYQTVGIVAGCLAGMFPLLFI